MSAEKNRSSSLLWLILSTFYRYIHPDGLPSTYTIILMFRLLPDSPTEAFDIWQVSDKNHKPETGVTIDRKWDIYKYKNMFCFLSNHTSLWILIKTNHLILFRIRILMCWLGRTNNLDLFLLCQHFNWPHRKKKHFYVRKTNKKSTIRFFIIKNNSYNNSHTLFLEWKRSVICL